MRVGYIRVSTIEQHEERQIKDLKENGEVERVYIDKLSGKDTNRPSLQELIDFVREGDTVVVSEYSRLARSTEDLFSIVKKLNDKGVSVVSLKENFDTSTPQGKLTFTLFAGIAEFERTLMLQRQKEGIAIAKAEGKYKGRVSKVKPNDWQELKDLYNTRQITATELAKRCNVSRPIVYKWLKEN